MFLESNFAKDKRLRFVSFFVTFSGLSRGSIRALGNSEPQRTVSPDFYRRGFWGFWGAPGYLEKCLFLMISWLSLNYQDFTPELRIYSAFQFFKPCVQYSCTSEIRADQDFWDWFFIKVKPAHQPVLFFSRRISKKLQLWNLFFWKNRNLFI